MGLQGPDFYDDDDVFATYQRSRARDESPNDTMEKPEVLELLGEVTGQRVIDLGCGDAQIGRELLAAGATSYLGVEPSTNMLQLARQTLAGTTGQAMQSTIEAWQPSPASADLVLSRLALHYVEDVAITFARCFEALTPGGRLIFSAEHPVLTSCDRGWPAGTHRSDWIVDEYYVSGRRVTTWMGQQVVKYHRSIAEYFGAVQHAGFTIEALREGRPRRQSFLREETYQRRLRIPLFLIIAARKPA
jgi:SAM-dependent methyltransferase